ncbi:MAG: peptidylprolyl isomerase [Candidatus Woesearchaeota archaeon]
MKVENNTKINVKYELVVDNEVIDSSENAELYIGFNMVVPGFEKNVIGMNVDEEKEFDVSPAEGYGEYRLELIQAVPISQFSPEERKFLVKGKTLQLYAQGMPLLATIKDVNDKDVVFDFNHPLAGKTLHFKVKILAIEPFSEEEFKQLLESLMHNHDHHHHHDHEHDHFDDQEVDDDFKDEELDDDFYDEEE